MSSIVFVPSFVQKTYDMIDNCDHNIASWTKHGDMFQIQDRKEFESRILPSYFGNKKFSSFTRQLNLYGFQKMQSAPNKNDFDPEIAKHPTFYNPHFQRGKTDSLINIQKQTNKKERKNGSGGSKGKIKKEPNNVVSADTSDSRHSVDKQNQIETLKKRVQSLEKDIEKLRSIILGQNQEQIQFHGNFLASMKANSSYHQLDHAKSDKNNDIITKHNDKRPSEDQGCKEYHDIEGNSKKQKRVNSDNYVVCSSEDFGCKEYHDIERNSTKRIYIDDDYLSHYFSDHIERQQSSSSFLSNDVSILYKFEPVSLMEIEPTPKRRKNSSGSSFKEATFDIQEFQSNSLETPVDRSKPTLPPHPKSKSHLPNDIQYLQIPVGARVSSDRQESFTSLSSSCFSLSFQSFENASFSHLDPSSMSGRETSLSFLCE